MDMQVKLFNEIQNSMAFELQNHKNTIQELQYHLEETCREKEIIETLHSNMRADTTTMSSKLDQELTLKDRVIEELGYAMHLTEKDKERLEYSYKQSIMKLDNFVLIIDKCENNI